MKHVKSAGYTSKENPCILCRQLINSDLQSVWRALAESGQQGWQEIRVALGSFRREPEIQAATDREGVTCGENSAGCNVPIKKMDSGD